MKNVHERRHEYVQEGLFLDAMTLPMQSALGLYRGYCDGEKEADEIFSENFEKTLDKVKTVVYNIVINSKGAVSTDVHSWCLVLYLQCRC